MVLASTVICGSESSWIHDLISLSHCSENPATISDLPLGISTKILWRNRPMRELLKFRNLKERDCATLAERCHALPPLPSPLFAPHCALLGYAVTTGSRNNKEGPRDLSDVTRNNTQRCDLRMSDSSVNKIDWRESISSRVPVVFMRVQVRVHNQFAASYRRELRRLFLWREYSSGIFGVSDCYSLCVEIHC
jgi:hypothetical protein